MVISHLQGRLANNLFQSMAALGYARMHGMDYGIAYDEHGDHKVIFDKFKKINVYTDGNYSRFTRYDEPNFEYNEIPKMEDVQLVGFFQSYKYFDHVREEVLDTIDFRYHKNSDTVSIHYRLGDYRNYPLSGPCNVLPIEYFRKAISIMWEGGYTKFMVFSDDLDYCQKLFESEFPECEFMFYNNKDEYESLSMMSSCAHNIICNSTFSWIAAYCNRNPDKIVISPSYDNWFGPEITGMDAKDLLPPEWVQIKFRE